MKEVLMAEIKKGLYEKLAKFGYFGSYDDFNNEIDQLILIINRLNNQDLNVSGGTSDFRKKITSGVLGLITALGANSGYTSAKENFDVSPVVKRSKFINKSDLRILAVLGTTFLLGGISGSLIISRFKKDPSVSLSTEEIKKFCIIDCWPENDNITDLSKINLSKIKKDVFGEFVNKLITYLKINNFPKEDLENTVNNFRLELNTENSASVYDYINKEIIKKQIGQDLNKNVFCVRYEVYCSAYKNKLTDYDKKLLEQNNALLTNQLQCAQDETNNMKTENRKLTSDLTDVQNEKDILNNRSSELEREVRNKEEEINRLKNQIEKIQIRNRKLTSDLTDVRNEKDKSSNRLSELGQEVQNKEEEINQLTNQVHYTPVITGSNTAPTNVIVKISTWEEKLTSVLENYIDMINTESNYKDTLYDCVIAAQDEKMREKTGIADATDKDELDILPREKEGLADVRAIEIVLYVNRFGKITATSTDSNNLTQLTHIKNEPFCAAEHSAEEFMYLRYMYKYLMSNLMNILFSELRSAWLFDEDLKTRNNRISTYLTCIPNGCRGGLELDSNFRNTLETVVNSIISTSRSFFRLRTDL